MRTASFPMARKPLEDDKWHPILSISFFLRISIPITSRSAYHSLLPQPLRYGLPLIHCSRSRSATVCRMEMPDTARGMAQDRASSTGMQDTTGSTVKWLS